MESSNSRDVRGKEIPAHHNLRIGLFYCEALEDIEYNGGNILRLLQEMGATFYCPALVDGPFTPPVLGDPVAELEASGRMSTWQDFTHELLEPTDKSDRTRWGFLGSVSTPGFRRSLSISCLGLRADRVKNFPAAIHELSTGRVRFMKELIARLKPRFGYVDEVFDDKLRNRVLQDAGRDSCFGRPISARLMSKSMGKSSFCKLRPGKRRSSREA
jgi:hypothetical protein